MNGRYALSDSAVERLAIATVTCNSRYFLANPQGIAPGYGDYEEFLAAFLEREILETRLDELKQDRRGREKILKDKLELAKKECARVIAGEKPKS